MQTEIKEKSSEKRSGNPLKRLYKWTLHWADTKYGVWVLILDSFAESSFFPVPPDILLIPLCLSKPKRALWYALLCSVFSVLGGIAGYLIGLLFMDTVGFKILQLYGATPQFQQISDLYHRYSAIAVAIAGFTPIPYKVFTIAAGACKIDFLIFLAASIVSRSARFFLVAGLLMIFGEKIKVLIDKYFNIASLVFVILLICGFLAIKYLF